MINPMNVITICKLSDRQEYGDWLSVLIFGGCICLWRSGLEDFVEMMQAQCFPNNLCGGM